MNSIHYQHKVQHQPQSLRVVFFSSFPQVSQFPHCPLYVHTVSHIDCELVKKPEHELSKLESTQVLKYGHEICQLLFLAHYNPPRQSLILMMRTGHGGGDTVIQMQVLELSYQKSLILQQYRDEVIHIIWLDISILWHSSQTPCNHLCTSHPDRTHSNKTWELNISNTATLGFGCGLFFCFFN